MSLTNATPVSTVWMSESTRCQEGAAKAVAASAAKTTAHRILWAKRIHSTTICPPIHQIHQAVTARLWGGAMSLEPRPLSASRIRHFKTREPVEGAPAAGTWVGRERLIRFALSTWTAPCQPLNVQTQLSDPLSLHSRATPQPPRRRCLLEALHAQVHGYDPRWLPWTGHCTLCKVGWVRCPLPLGACCKPGITCFY